MKLVVNESLTIVLSKLLCLATSCEWKLLIYYHSNQEISCFLLETGTRHFKFTQILWKIVREFSTMVCKVFLFTADSTVYTEKDASKWNVEHLYEKKRLTWIDPHRVCMCIFECVCGSGGTEGRKGLFFYSDTTFYWSVWLSVFHTIRVNGYTSEKPTLIFILFTF